MRKLRIRLVYGGLMTILFWGSGESLASDAALNFATGLMVREEYGLAIEELEGIVGKDPQFEQLDKVLFRLGESYYQIGESQPAIDALRKLTENHPGSAECPRAFFRLGQMLAEKDALESAKSFSYMADEWPEHNLAAAARYRAGDAFLRVEQFKEAEFAFRRVIEAFPATEYAEHARYALGLAILRQPNRLAEALASFDAFVKAHAGSFRRTEAALKMADCLYALGRYEEALDAYQALRDDPDPIGREAARGVAWCLYDLGRFGEAVDAFEQAADVQEEPDLQSTCLFNAGNSAVRSVALERAVTIFSEFVRRFPAHELVDDARYWQGKSLMRLKKNEQAVTVLKKLVDEAGSTAITPDALYALAEAQRELGNNAVAAARFEQVVEQYPKNRLVPAALYGAVLVRDALGEAQAAVALARDLIRRYPGNEFTSLARFALGECLFKLKDYKNAFDAFNAADGVPENVQDDRHYKMAWALFHLKQFESAAARFRALADKPVELSLIAECRYMAGRCAFEAGEMDSARVQFAKAAEAFPNTPSGARASLALATLDLSTAARSDTPENVYEAVVRRLEKLLEGEPLPSEVKSHAALTLAQALQQLDRHADALNALRAIGEADEAVAEDVAFAIAWSLYREGKHAEALEKFTALSERDGIRSADASFWRSRLLESADPARAAAAYAAFQKRFADHGWNREARYREALMQARSGETGKARAAFRRIAEEDPESPFAPDALYDLAWLLKESADDPESRAGAVVVFKELVERFPQSDRAADGMFRIGEAAQDRGEAAVALEWYRKVRETGGFHEVDTLWYRMGWCHLDLEQYPQAEKAFATLADDYPDSDLANEAHYRAGISLKHQGLHRKAVARFDAVAGEEFAEPALFACAESCRADTGYREAIERYRKLLKAFPEGRFTVRAMLGLAHSLRAAGAHADAIEAYADVVNATDAVEAAQACLGSGYSRLALEQPREAVREFLKVDIVYGYDELKPEALRMLVACFERMDDQEKAERYRRDLKTRFPETP